MKAVNKRLNMASVDFKWTNCIDITIQKACETNPSEFRMCI